MNKVAKRAISATVDPFGWVKREAKPPRPRFDRAEVADLAAELRAGGLSWRAVAAELTRRGVRTARGLTTWRASTLVNLLRRAGTGGPWGTLSCTSDSDGPRP